MFRQLLQVTRTLSCLRSLSRHESLLGCTSLRSLLAVAHKSWLSTTGKTSSLFDLKTLMRQLMRRVHPDLFHNYPSAKEVNQTSLKLLNAFLNDYHLGKLEHPVRSFDVQFYLKKQGAPQPADKISVKFFFPEVEGSNRANVLEEYVSFHLSDLFRKAGLSAPEVPYPTRHQEPLSSRSKFGDMKQSVEEIIKQKLLFADLYQEYDPIYDEHLPEPKKD